MRFIALVTCLMAAAVATSCSGGTTPAAPTALTQTTVSGSDATAGGTASNDGTVVSTAVSLVGAVRGVNAGSATFSLVTRTGTRTILTDAQTQVWSQGTRIRLGALVEGQSVSVRGEDYARYVLARTISVN